MMKVNINVQNIKKKLENTYEMKTSTSINEKIIIDFLNGDNDNSNKESDLYIIEDDCVYGRTQMGMIFLFYKENNDIFYKFSENNKKYTKKLLPLITDKFTLYLMHHEIAYPKVRRDIFNMVNRYDMVKSMISIYINERYYEILNASGYDFLDILFRQVKEFGAEEELFSEEMTRNIDKYTESKYDDSYPYWHRDRDVPMIDIPDVYLEMKSENLKRVYKINSIIS